MCIQQQHQQQQQQQHIALLQRQQELTIMGYYQSEFDSRMRFSIANLCA
jgi:hypothetical protein